MCIMVKAPCFPQSRTGPPVEPAWHPPPLTSSTSCWACQSSRLCEGIPSCCRRGRGCSSRYGAMCCRASWQTRQVTGGFREMEPVSKKSCFFVPRCGRRPRCSAPGRRRLLWCARGPGSLLQGWLVLHSCQSALVDELMCGRTGPSRTGASSCRTAVRWRKAVRNNEGGHS